MTKILRPDRAADTEVEPRVAEEQPFVQVFKQRMGACQSSQDGEEEEKKKRSRQIDAELEQDQRRLRKECKILLLGK